jgi:hypothetical protein
LPAAATRTPGFGSGVATASGRPSELVAFDGDIAVGWCRLAPRAELAWLAWLAQARYLGPVEQSAVLVDPLFLRAPARTGGVA